MYFLFIQLFLMLFSVKVSTLHFGQSCSKTCGFPGLICVGERCVCDWKLDLFWTGARCLACPKGWIATETKCVRYFATKLTWTKAAETCRQIQADLISFYDPNILSLMYQVTGDIYRRKKRDEIATDSTVGWTSARAIQLTGLGLYQWSDTSLVSIDSRSLWWCRQGIPGFIYHYQYNEPTRNYLNNIGETCVLYRRGTTSTGVLCLDDVFCDGEYPFVCERTESTARKYFGPPPSDSDSGNHSSNGNTTGGGGISGGNSSNTSNNHGGGMVPAAHASKSNKKSKTILIPIILSGLLLLVGVFIGVFFFMKRRSATAPQFQVSTSQKKEDQPSTNTQPEVKPDIKVDDICSVDEPVIEHIKSEETDLTLNAGAIPENTGLNIGNLKQQKNKRGGYSKQQFENEFE